MITRPDDTPVRASAHLVHLIGIVEETTAGLRLRLGAEADAPPIGEEIPARRERARYRLRPEDILRLFPGIAVCIIHAPPSRTMARRLDGDRRHAVLARVFAARVFAEGVPLVAVIPPLQPRDTSQVLSGIARAVVDSGPSRIAAVREAIGEARRFVVGQVREGGAPQGWEAAYDLCLFAIADRLSSRRQGVVLERGGPT
jgi:hypothetical protein